MCFIKFGGILAIVFLNVFKYFLVFFLLFLCSFGDVNHVHANFDLFPICSLDGIIPIFVKPMGFLSPSYQSYFKKYFQYCHFRLHIFSFVMVYIFLPISTLFIFIINAFFFTSLSSNNSCLKCMSANCDIWILKSFLTYWLFSREYVIFSCFIILDIEKNML